MFSAIFERCNTLAQSWAWWLGMSILDAALVLAVVSLLWFAIRRKAPPQLGYLLFLLVPLKLFVPLHVSIPDRFLSWLPNTAPRMAASGLGQEAEPTAPPFAAPTTEKAISIPREMPHETSAPPEFDSASVDRAMLPLPSSPLALKIIPPKTTALSFFSWLMFAWVLGLFALLIRLIHAQVHFHRSILRGANMVDPKQLFVDFDSLLKRMRLGRQIRVVESGRISSPVVWGIFRPTLILPTGFAKSLSPKQLEWVLLHELAHVRRRDLAVNCFQRAAGILYFVNPSIWIANRAIDRLREYACDDMASAYGGISQVESGEAFLGVMRYAAKADRRPKTHLEGALGMFELSVRSSCFKRMTRLLDTNRRLSVKIRRGSICLLLLTAALALPQIRAANEQPPKEKAESPASITAEKKKEKTPTSTEVLAEMKEKEQNKAKNEDSLYRFNVIIAKHVNLLEGREIVDWPDIEAIISKRPNPSQTQPHFYITRGARDAGKDELAKTEIWRLHQNYKLVGHSEGSLLPRADFRYDRIQTADDLKPDESLRIDGKVLDKNKAPVADAEIILVTTVDSSLPYKAYDIPLVEGRVRDQLDEVLTQSDEKGQFSIYPPKDQEYFLIALHPDFGIGYVGLNQFAPDHTLQLLQWSGLVSEFGEAPERQEADLRSRLQKTDDHPEITFCQYGSDLKRSDSTRQFGFKHIPPIINATLSRAFSLEHGGAISLSGASVSLLPGETRRIDLGPLTEQQLQELERMRHDSEERQKKATAEVPELKSQPKKAETPKPAATSDAPIPKDWKPGQTLDFQAIDEKTKQPVSGMKLSLQFHGPGINFMDVKAQNTNADGRSTIPLPDKRPDAVRIYTDKPGYVPMRIYWGDDLPSATLPKSITVPIEPGTVWGGIVKNEKDEPVPNVQVNVRYWGHSSEFNPHLRANIDDDIAGTTTDKDGRWRLDILPATFDDEGPRLFFTHPDYISDHLTIRGNKPLPVKERPSYESLRSQTAVTILLKGATVEGHVTDEAGEPVRGATICKREECYHDSFKISATADDNGRFTISGLNNANESDLILTVEAAGYSPELLEIDLDDIKPQEVKLKPGLVLEGEVVDENGKPVEGVNVQLENWKDHNRRLPRKTATDAQGKFHLADVPLTDAKYTFEKQDYMMIDGFPMSPTPIGHYPVSQFFKVTMRPPVWVAGTIVDAETNQPLPKCKVIYGFENENGQPIQWWPIFVKTVDDGRYEFEFRQVGSIIRIRAEAEGYLPGMSRPFKFYDPDRGHLTCDFKLQKSAPLSGAVLDTDGRPLADVEVYLTTWPFSIKNRKAGYYEKDHTRTARTDPQGRFEFPPQIEPFSIIALNERGIAKANDEEFKKSPTLRLEPWTEENENTSVDRRPQRPAQPAPASRRITVTKGMIEHGSKFSSKDGSLQWTRISTPIFTADDGFRLSESVPEMPGHSLLMLGVTLHKLDVTDEEKARLEKVRENHKSEFEQFVRKTNSRGLAYKAYNKTIINFRKEQAETIQKELDEILTPEQQQTYKNIERGERAWRYLSNYSNDANLQLTESQKKQLDALRHEDARERQQRFQKFEDGILAVLTPKQREQLREVAFGPYGIDWCYAETLYLQGQDEPIFLYTLSPYPADLTTERAQKDLGLTTEQKEKVREILGGSGSVTEKLLRELLKLTPEERKARQNIDLQYVSDLQVKLRGRTPEETQQKQEKYLDQGKADRKARWTERQNQPLMQMTNAIRKQFEAILTPEQLTASRDRAVRQMIFQLWQDAIVRHEIGVTEEQDAAVRRLYPDGMLGIFMQTQWEYGEKMWNLLTPTQQEKIPVSAN